MKDLKDFKEKVIDLFSEKLTDKVFLMIQNDRELMRDYLAIIEKSNSLAYVNSEIAKEVKKRYDLKNLNQRNEEPESLLIQTHEMFETK
ncbi:hypothetical protein BX611_2960 [Lutibacter oceani]|uniref:Uncharacterized protein n=1 Tax=Lutibacter oceani TaxID=1853311 RepID=A0A3D9RQX5_9FLAO|nr:hypothetical protein [Lutibacter oceani]REE78825.1 hypothetical protein BX611_2960 [Lutibacter oceani]